MTSTEKSKKINKFIYYSVALIASYITLMVYMPSLEAGFVNWDDGVYVYENTDIRSLGVGFFKWVSTAVISANWHPLTMLSLAIDYALWGSEPFGYHLTNLFLHLLNTILVAVITIYLITIAYGSEKKRILKFTAGILTALLFGIHPTHVESVAWISERKDVLCAFFFLLSLFAYTCFAKTDKKERQGYYILALFFFLLALLSKPMAITLPVIFIILDFYPLNRITDLQKIIIEKLPFFALSVGSAIVTILTQGSVGAIRTLDVIPLWSRTLNAAHSYVFYLKKMIMPFDLVPFHPFNNEITLGSVEFLIPIAILIALGTISLIYVKKYKILLATLLFYIITLTPVIGIIQVGSQAAADRYTYLPFLGPFILIGVMIGAFIEKIFKKTKSRILALLIITAVIIVPLIDLTSKQIPIWKSSVALWSKQIEVYPDPKTAHGGYYNRGRAYLDKGELHLAINDFNRAVINLPNDPKAFNVRGSAYAELGHSDKAEQDFLMTILLDPEHAGAHYNLGLIYMARGEKDNARKLLKKASELGISKAGDELKVLGNTSKELLP
ncbi:MAG: tetratricopeptide repeat protein [Deltaproteobacteria bacterium]|nr:tetratricopeptide repeat protein [Deltaproteobacteria bacterium]